MSRKVFGVRVNPNVCIICVSVPRVTKDPAPCGPPSHPPAPEAAEGAAHLLRNPRLHFLHHQEQLHGNRDRETWRKRPEIHVSVSDRAEAQGFQTSAVIRVGQGYGWWGSYIGRKASVVLTDKTALLCIRILSKFPLWFRAGVCRSLL